MFFLHNIRIHWSGLPPQNKTAGWHRVVGRKDKQKESMQNLQSSSKGEKMLQYLEIACDFTFYGWRGTMRYKMIITFLMIILATIIARRLSAGGLRSQKR